MAIQQRTWLGWSGVAITFLFMLLVSALILYPTTTNENILLALRFSSVTTALPFWLIFVAKPLTIIARELGQWANNNRFYLWLIATISHLIHLYQIFLYYQLGQSCPLTVWLITSPLWIFLVLFSGLALIKPQFFEQVDRANTPQALSLLYTFGIWYIWLVFTLAFGLSAAGKHLLFYNIPAFILFLAAAIISIVYWWQRRMISN